MQNRKRNGTEETGRDGKETEQNGNVVGRNEEGTDNERRENRRDPKKKRNGIGRRNRNRTESENHRKRNRDGIKTNEQERTEREKKRRKRTK